MPEPVAEPALNGLRLNLRIVSIVMFNFASYLTIGLPLAVLPGYVHDAMGFSAFWAGLIISLQYFATLLSRPHAGRYADVLGPKKIVVFGLFGCFLSGLGYLLADIADNWPMISLLLLGLGRVILGIGQSFAGTGSTLWGVGVGVVGSLHIGRVISWNGIVTYGAMAMGAPLGVVAVKAVPPQNQGAALATYTVFMDLSLGITGPLAGLVMAWAGVPVIYLVAAGLVAMALLLTWRLKKRPPSALPEAASSS
ncbi:MFS transporter [Salmonella enterica]|nr:MFS transporter [Salmonella enterica]EKP2145250.1 MFS transporter [Salmonella enterica]EKP2149972.1 MFS transporter [Salmonella enterica]